MENLNHDTIIYSLSVKDLQTVAFEEMGRELSQREIENITDLVAANISWYDAIANAIRSEIKTEEYS